MRYAIRSRRNSSFRTNRFDKKKKNVSVKPFDMVLRISIPRICAVANNGFSLESPVSYRRDKIRDRKRYMLLNIL